MGYKSKDRGNYSNVWFNPDYSNANQCEDHKHRWDDRDDTRDHRDDRGDDQDDVRGRRDDHHDDRNDARDRGDNRHDDKKRPWLFTL